MSMRTDDLYLVDIIESAQAVAAMIRGCDLPSFVGDDMLRSAVLWKLYVISEAAGKLSGELRELFTDVPWDQIRAFRNRLAHGYFTLQWDRVWDIAAQNTPTLRLQAEAILAERFPQVFRQLQDRRAHGSP